MPKKFILMAVCLFALVWFRGFGSAQEGGTALPSEEAAEQEAAKTDEPPVPVRRPPKKLPAPPGARRLSPDFDVWVDSKKAVVYVDGEVSLREGMLEMFACTRHTKEHEAIVSANTKAYLVHAGLVAVGAEAGSPVQFVPEYKPAAGTEIEVLVQWTDEDGNEQTLRAQEWIKDIRTDEAMTHSWVFGGSRFWTDPETGKQYYQAEQGDFICVSNFGTAMLDLPIESSPENNELAFQTFTERIPPLGTPVRLILKPKLQKGKADDKQREKQSIRSEERPSEPAAKAQAQ
jgi:hypothetical protein